MQCNYPPQTNAIFLILSIFTTTQLTQPTRIYFSVFFFSHPPSETRNMYSARFKSVLHYTHIQQPRLPILKYWQNSRSQLDTRKWKSIQTNNKDIQISVCRKYINLLKENVRENPIPLWFQHMGTKPYITERYISSGKILCI